MKRKIICLAIVAVALCAMFAVPALAASSQIYIYNSSAGFVKMTGSLYAYTPSGSVITLGMAITRSDYIPGQTPLYNTADIDAYLYKNYPTDNQYVHTVEDGTLLGIAESGSYIAIGSYVSTGFCSTSASNDGGYHRMVLPNGSLYVNRMGIILSGGVLSQDNLATW